MLLPTWSHSTTTHRSLVSIRWLTGQQLNRLCQSVLARNRGLPHRIRCCALAPITARSTRMRHSVHTTCPTTRHVIIRPWRWQWHRQLGHGHIPGLLVPVPVRLCRLPRHRPPPHLTLGVHHRVPAAHFASRCFRPPSLTRQRE